MNIINASDLQQLKTWQQEQELSDEQVKKFAKKAYKIACKSATIGVLSPERKQGLKRLQAFLAIDVKEFAKEEKELVRHRRYYDISQGQLPTAYSTLITKADEKVHCCLEGELREERVLSRDYRGGSHGIGVRVSDNVGLSLGGQREKIQESTGVTTVDYGDLIITNQRAVFLGGQHSFEVYYRDLLSWNLVVDELIFHTKQGVKTVEITDDKFDYTELDMVLYQLIDIDLLS